MNDRVMLFAQADGRLVNANYLTSDTGPLNLITEAIQVEGEIWVSDTFSDAVRRFSLDGQTFVGSIVGPFNPPMRRPEGLAYDGTTVYVACHQIETHGLFASWITKLNPNGTPAGLFTMPDDRHRFDLVSDNGELLVSDEDDQSLDRVSTVTGAVVGRIDAFPQVFGHEPTQVLRLSSGEIALGTTQGLRVYDAAGSLIEEHLGGVRINGVGELGTGELMISLDRSAIALDRATGAERTLATGLSGRLVSEIAGATVCPADVNADGEVTPSDFTAWINEFNKQSPAADQNGDGSVMPDDFTAWIDNFNNGC
ncbi:MAG: hypothetical protein ED559_01590 [Phycisphaera sp.]|nr:MAG: hypothetical protein ED559_01590 [Phycisphaera sp.]